MKIMGKFSTNVDVCSFPRNELSEFSSVALNTIHSIICPPENSKCNVKISSVCGRENNQRLLSTRYLQSQNWQIEFIITQVFTCEVASCTSPGDKAAVSALTESISNIMSNSIGSGSLVTLLSSNIVKSSGLDHSIVNCLVLWGTVGETTTEVGDPGTGVFYPDWENQSGTCLHDGNEPDYMKDSTTWVLDSLEECCYRFFPGWNFNKCMNVRGSGLWYVSHLNGKCVTDCEEGYGETCGGLANPIADHLYADARSCCESELPWRFVEYCQVSVWLTLFCIYIKKGMRIKFIFALVKANSLLSKCYAGTGLYYRGDSAGRKVCVRDCSPSSKLSD